jgi:DNA-directed RNA polymerase specialized sigma24 family protein
VHLNWQKDEGSCPINPKPTSERARRRALGKIHRELLIKRRETYFDLLVSGYSIDEIASRTQKSPSAVRRAIAQALANRRLHAPGDPMDVRPRPSRAT